MATTTDKSKSKGADAGQAELQQQADADEAKGYSGYTPDTTPNENYSLETPQSAPTPETEAAKKVAEDREARKAKRSEAVG